MESEWRAKAWIVVVFAIPLLALISYLFYVFYLKDAMVVCPPDCAQADLRNTDLNSDDLVGANLDEANLTRANLAGFDFSDASLYFTIFQEANLQQANFQRL